MTLKKIEFNNGVNLTIFTSKGNDVSIILLIPSGHADKVPEAHFLEHMAFQSNTHKNAQEISFELEGKAIRYEAWTFNDRTQFHMITPSQYVETALDTLFECFTNTVFQQDEVDREKEILKGELSTILSDPFHSMEQKMKACVYQNHPLNISEETYETIQAVTPQILASAKQPLFFTNDFVLGLSGNFKPKKIFHQIETTFGALPKEKNTKPPFPTQRPTFHEEMEERTDITTSCILIAFPVVGIEHPDSIVLDFIAHLLGGSRGGYVFSNRLFQEIRAKQGLAYETHTLYESYKGIGLFVLSASGMKKQNVPKVKTILLEQLGRLTQEEIISEELERAKINILTSEYRNRYSRLGLLSSSLCLSELYHIPYGFESFTQQINMITPQRIKDVANQYFDGNYFIGTIVPK